MKPYGFSRRDKLSCRYGCCDGYCGRKRNCRKIVQRNRRKTARQYAKHQTAT